MFQNKMHIFLFPVLPQRYPSLSLHIAIALTVAFVTYFIILLKKCNLEFVYPRSSQEFLRTRLILSVRSWSNWNLEMLVFGEYQEKTSGYQRFFLACVGELRFVGRGPTRVRPRAEDTSGEAASTRARLVRGDSSHHYATLVSLRARGN